MTYQLEQLKSSHLGDVLEKDVDALAHGGGGAALGAPAADLEANGRWRTKGFVDSFEAVEENSCLLFSWTFKFFIKPTNNISIEEKYEARISYLGVDKSQ